MKKRDLPQNVDSQIKICSVMPLKSLLIVSPVVAVIGGGVLIKPTPLSLFAGGIAGAFVIGLGCEFNNELGIDILKSIIRYKRRGNVTFDRGTELTPIEKRFINRKK